MPFTVTKYPAGTFSWTDVSSTDIAATKDFMTKLMGWTAQDMPTGGGPDYTMFYVGDKTVAGGSGYPPEMKGVPSAWNNYVTVDDIDAATAKAVELGAKVVLPVMDVLDVGRMSGIQDPMGAYLFLWQAKKHIGAELVNTVGAMVWNELYVKDLKQAEDFYGQLFGWTFEPMDGSNDYFVIKNNGRSNGGMMAITSEMGNMPAMWLVYFTVADIDKTMDQAKALGGQVHMTKEIGLGRLAMIADPTGATFMAMQFNGPVDEWVE